MSITKDQSTLFDYNSTYVQTEDIWNPEYRIYQYVNNSKSQLGVW